MEGKEFLVGDEPSTADFLMTCMVRWRADHAESPRERKNVMGLLERVSKRESWGEVCKREGMRKWP